jgi:hypothetical protein
MTDILETYRAEQAESVELIHAGNPDISDADAEWQAAELRCHIYRKGRWPTVEDVRAWHESLTNGREHWLTD